MISRRTILTGLAASVLAGPAILTLRTPANALAAAKHAIEARASRVVSAAEFCERARSLELPLHYIAAPGRMFAISTHVGVGQEDERTLPVDAEYDAISCWHDLVLAFGHREGWGTLIWRTEPTLSSECDFDTKKHRYRVFSRMALTGV